MADLGGSILTGIDGNPLAVLARQLRIPLHDIDFEEVPLYLPDGSRPDSQLDKQVASSIRSMNSKSWMLLGSIDGSLLAMAITGMRSGHDRACIVCAKLQSWCGLVTAMKSLH